MLVADLLALAERQRVCRARRVLDLAPVDPALREVPDLLRSDTLGGCTHLADERGPDLLLRLRAQLAEV